MKTSIILKAVLILPIILFVDYLIMVAIGCTTCFLGVNNDFYCGPYCKIGMIIIALSAMFFGYLIHPEIFQLLKSLKNATPKEK